MEIEHLTVPVRDYDASKAFYSSALKPLGFELLLDWIEKRQAYFGPPPAPSVLWLVESEVAGGLEISLAVAGAEVVDAFHAAATAAGARTIHEPGICDERSSKHYATRVLDPDGNSIEAVHRTASGARAAA
jgi:catechol 2,3-dioxygenase-like lactoylglutathione lyase family enzyme